MKLYLKIFIISLVIIVSGVVCVYSAIAHVGNIANGLIYEKTEDIPESQVAIVLGAKVRSDLSPSPMLEDRLLTAWDLYNAGKVEKILLSGDHGRPEYDEVNAMKDYLLAKEIPAEHIFLDHAGFDTYDSIYRAKEIFAVDSLTIITQEFHLPRALYIAKSLDLDAVGLKADRQDYAGVRNNYRREIPAKLKAYYNVLLDEEPKYLGEQIPVTGDSRQSWD
ncbi:vancomycin high temperature exclusion protein [Patescibacteria group bacterium]